MLSIYIDGFMLIRTEDSIGLTHVGKFSLINVSHRYARLERNKSISFSRQEHKGGNCKGEVGGLVRKCGCGLHIKLSSVLYCSDDQKHA